MKLRQNNEKLADECYAEGRQTFYDNRLDESALLIQRALHLYKECENYEKYTMSLNLMGVIYAAIGNETMAIDCYLEGLESAIDHGYTNIVTLFYNNIGSRYQELGEYEKAIEYFLKASKELTNPSCVTEERHDNWCLITHLNLVASYRYMGSYELAEKYLKIAETYMIEDNIKLYKYTFLILKCRLFWSIGKQEFVYEHIEELLESGSKSGNTSDYVQDIQDLCSLLQEMKEYERWKSVILDYEKYANEQHAVYFKLVLTELWMEYYREVGDQEKYVQLCVKHVELNYKQKEVTDKEHAAAIDLKIQLREKEAERRRAEALSSTDALTGVGNRHLLTQETDAIIKKAVAEGQKIAVGILDIDYFKQHNDTYGHIKGDETLKKVARIIQDSVSVYGHVYRFGGDEFVIISENGERENVEGIARTIQRKLKEAHIANINSEVSDEITISQGFSCFIPTGEDDWETIIRHADDALYYVKKNGRNAYHIIVEK